MGTGWKDVDACVVPASAGIADAPSDGTFYGRRNAAWVNPSHSDITDWAAALAASLSSYAPLLSPALIGAPTGPTPAPGDNSTKLATTAFVTAAVVASTSGVASFNGRTGAVVQTSLDITTALGFTPYNSTNPSGYQTAAQVSAAISAIGAPPAPSSTVPAMDGSPAVGTAMTYARADHVHPSDTSRAPLASPAFSGTPTAPTASPGDSSTKLATTAYVGAAIGAISTPHVPTMQIFLTGTGTYTKPAGVTWLRARAVAAGAGGYGGGGPSTPTAPGAGGNTTFGPLTANGGGIGSWTNGTGGIGGTASIGAGWVGMAIKGGDGGGVSSGSSGQIVCGGIGGSSVLGGAGTGGGYDVTIINPTAGAPNSGGGGGGGGTDLAVGTFDGPGGGSGGFFDAICTAPATSYSYSVGAAGTGGPSGANGGIGEPGGSGGIWIEEHYGS